MSELPVWMAPALQGLFDGMAAKSGTFLCPALYEVNFVKVVLGKMNIPIEPGVSR